MEPPTLLLVRHAAATGQDPDARLTPEGSRDADRLADLLKGEPADLVVSSPMRRAHETARRIAVELAMPVHLDIRLVERRLTGEHRADWRDLLRESFLDGERSFEGGESGDAAAHRALSAITEIVRRGCSRPILVTHGNLLTLILRHFRPEVGFAEWESLGAPDAYRLAPVQEGWRLERLWPETP